MKNKKIIILDHKGGRLCNQLWNYISVYAYCLEKNYQCHNYSLYKYDNDFNIQDKDLLYKIFLLLNTTTYVLGKNRFVHKLYRWYVNHMETKYGDEIIDSGFDFLISGVTYLPPTPPRRPLDTTTNNIIANSKHNTTYLEGWLFRNPVGIEKYRKEIHHYFLPKKQIRIKAESFTKELRSKYKHLLGIHIRQGDYIGDYLGAQSPAAKIYVNEEEASSFIGQYLSLSRKSPQETCLVICSDGPVDIRPFQGLNVTLSKGDPVQDVYTLSLTDVVIGTNSTFGAYASYYGNIPFVVFDKNGLDWEYYRDKTKYFENKYCKVVNY